MSGGLSDMGLGWFIQVSYVRMLVTFKHSPDRQVA